MLYPGSITNGPYRDTMTRLYLSGLNTERMLPPGALNGEQN